MKNPDSDEPVRIQKVIAQAGVASRRAAEDLIGRRSFSERRNCEADGPENAHRKRPSQRGRA